MVPEFRLGYNNALETGVENEFGGWEMVVVNIRKERVWISR